MAKQNKTTSSKPILAPEKTIEKKPSFWKQNLWSALVLAGLAFVLYIYSAGFDYALDDKIVIQDNSFVKKGTAGIGDIMSKETFTGYFGEQKNLVEGARYRPLSLVTFAIEFQRFKTEMRNEKGQLLRDGATNKQLYVGNPGISHIINVLLYMLCGLILFRVLSMLWPVNEGEKWYFSLPFVASLLFVAHPIHVEVVANIKGRDEILVMIFAFASFYACIRYIHNQRFIHLISAGIYFFLGLLSKENTITFLAVIPVAIYFFIDEDRNKIMKMMSPLLIATVVFLFIRYRVIGYFLSNGNEITDIMNNPFYGMTTSERLATTFYTLGKYITLLFFPHPLTHDYYPYQIPKLNWSSIYSIVSLVVYMALGAYALLSLRTKSLLGFGVIFFLATLSIVSNIPVSIGTFMNDRFVFIPSIGFCVIAAWFIVKKLPTWLPTGGSLPIASAVLLGVISLGFSIKTLDRVPDWRNGDTLNESSIKVSTGSARANLFMGTTLFERWKITKDTSERRRLIYESAKYMNRALEILPDYGSAQHMKTGVAAELFMYDNNVEKLLSDFEKALKYRSKLTIVNAAKGNTFADTYIEYLLPKPAYKTGIITFLKRVYPQFIDSKDKTNALRYINYGLQLEPTDATFLAAKTTADALK